MNDVKIWCVDDDPPILDIEVYTLNSTGFKAKGFADGASMIRALKTDKPDLIVLDIMLPGEDGICILKKLRGGALTQDIPVIMATAKGAEMDKIQGLDLGADDYLVKPFGMMEMASRIRAVLRRCRDAEQETLTAGMISLNEKERRVSVGGEKVGLTLKEFELLKLFLKNPKIVFGRDQLLSEVWGHDFMGETRTVDVHIKNLRRKLGKGGKHIKTIIGVGYCFEE